MTGQSITLGCSSSRVSGSKLAWSTWVTVSSSSPDLSAVTSFLVMRASSVWDNR